MIGNPIELVPVDDAPSDAKTVDVQTRYAVIRYCTVEQPVKAQPLKRARLSNPKNPAVVQLERQVTMLTDQIRRLELLKTYRERGEYERVDELVQRWRAVIGEAVDALWTVSRERGVDFKDKRAFIRALGIDTAMIPSGDSGDEEDDGESEGSDEANDESKSTELSEADSVIDALAASD